MARRRLLKYFYAIYGGERYDGTFTVPSFPTTGGTASFVINSTTPWELVSKPNWIAMSVSSGGMGATNVTITASPNTSTTELLGSIVLGTKNGWSGELSIACSVQPTSAWITVDGSSESPQTKEINWNATNTSFVIASNGGWKYEKVGSWTGGLTPTGNTASTSQTANLTGLTQNTSSANVKTQQFTVTSSADTSKSITVSVNQGVKPNAIFGKVGTNIGNNVYALPYNGQNGTVTVSANTNLNVTGTTPSTNYVSMATPITGEGLYAKNVNYTALTLNTGQTGLSAYTYVLSANSSDNAASSVIDFNYEPYPYLPDVISSVASSASTGGSVSAESNYWLDIVDIKKLEKTTQVVDHAVSFSSAVTTPTGASTHGISMDSDYPVSNGYNTSANTSTRAQFMGYNRADWSGYVYYAFTMPSISSDVITVDLTCSFHAQFRGAYAPTNLAGINKNHFQLCVGGVPVGTKATLSGGTGNFYLYTVKANGIPVDQLSDVKLMIYFNLKDYNEGVGFGGATLGIDCYTTGSSPATGISAWTVHYQSTTPLSASVINYSFRNTPGPAAGEAYTIFAEAHSARTVGNNVYQMLGPSISGQVLTVIREGNGSFASLTASAASQTIPSTGETELFSIFDDGEGNVRNVTSATTWTINSGGAYGSIRTANNRYYLSGHNTSDSAKAVNITAAYSGYSANVGVTVNGPATAVSWALEITAYPLSIAHNGTSEITSYWVGYDEHGTPVDYTRVDPTAITWDIVYGDAYCTTGISGTEMYLYGDNNTSTRQDAMVSGVYQDSTAYTDYISIEGTGTTYYDLTFRVINSPALTADTIGFTAKWHSAGSTTNAREWTVHNFEEDDEIDWEATKAGYRDASGSYTITAGTGNLIEIEFDELPGPCLEVTPTGDTVSATGTTYFEAYYSQYCEESTPVEVTSAATWSVYPTGFGTITDPLHGEFTAANPSTADTSVTITATYSGISDSAVVDIDGYVAPTPKYTVTFVVDNGYTADTISYTASTGNDSRRYVYGTWAITNIPENTLFEWDVYKTWYSSESDSFTVTGDTTITIHPHGNLEASITARTFWTGSTPTDVDITVYAAGTENINVEFGFNTTAFTLDLGVPANPTITFGVAVSGSNLSGCNLTIETNGGVELYDGPATSMGTLMVKAEDLASCDFYFDWT